MILLRQRLRKKSFALRGVFAGLLVMALATCGSDDPVQSGGEGLPQSSGVHQQMLLPSNQRYTISIPSGYDGQQPVPLVLSLHFGGEVTAFYGGQMLEILVRPALEDLGAIIVAPDAMRGGWANEESEQDLINLMRVIKENYNIDEAKTLVTGFSMGGRGTWYMAARHPELFTAAIPISASPESNATEIDWQMPLLVIHSTADEVVAFAPVETAVRALLDKGVNIDMIVVQGVTHFQTSSFIAPLNAAVPWVQEAWGE